MYKLFMAFRYLRAHKIIYFSIAGVAVGIMAIVCVTSIMSGFARDMRARIRGMQTHIVVAAAEKNFWIVDYDDLCREIEAIPNAAGCAPRIEYEAWMSRRGSYKDVHLVGVDPERERTVSDVEKYFRQGFKQSFDFRRDSGAPTDRPGVVVGAELLGGPVLGLLTALAGDFPILCSREFEQVGTFRSGMAEYDSTYVFMHLADAQEFLKKSAGEDRRAAVNLLAVAVDDYEAHGRSVRDAILARLHERRPCMDASYHRYGQCGLFRTQTWEQARRILLQAVEVEKGIQIIIMFLIVLVAGFNIIAIYTLVVRAKTRDIGILRALGATEGGVTLIFLLSGGLCGLFGSMFGIILGLLLSYNFNEISDFIRVASRELNTLSRGGLAGAGAAVLASGVSLIWTWLAFYRERGRFPAVRVALTAVLLGVATWLSTGWVPKYRPYDRYDPELGESFRVVLAAAVVGIWGFLVANWAALRRWRRHPSWIFFGFGGTIVFIAYTLALLATGSIIAAILGTRPDLGWAGLELFSRQIYYLDRIPVFVDYQALTFIVAITLLVSVIFSIYPAIRAARANPVESMRDE